MMTEYNDKLRVPYGMAVHDTEEENAVLEIIKNKKTIMGDKVKQFENEVSTLFYFITHYGFFVFYNF
jgi:dTDP-4-amino-4,6-dideoxygalactose transaminase